MNNSIIDMVGWLPRPITFTTNEVARRMLLDAYKYANNNSPDPSTKNGAVLVGEHGDILTHGVNKFPDGIAETEDRLADKTIKYRLVVHAENGAIFNAAAQGKRSKGSILYCPFYACSECAKAIIQGGIVEIVGHAQLMTFASKHTTWVQSIIDGWNVLQEAGIICTLYDGIIGITTRFNGKDIAV